MEKLVVLELDGNLHQGLRVTLEIKSEGVVHSLTRKGHLPPDPELATDIETHWQKYRNLGVLNRRIKPQQIIHGGSINQCQTSAQRLREGLNIWLKSEGFRDIDSKLREELNREEEIRFLIRTDDNLLQKLPWHEWNFFESYRHVEPALSPIESETLDQSTTDCRKNKIRILAILGNSEGIDIEKDRELLEKLPNVDPVFLVEPKHEQINDKLWEQPWDIIFFAGHSETDEKKGIIHINPTDSLTVDQLWYGLKKAVEGGLKLAIFNSCDGLGLARQLNDKQIPQMIVMRELVPDLVAQEFLKHFLTEFSSGKSFYRSVREARERLQGLESKIPCASWLPVICQNPAVVPPNWQDLIGESEVENEPSETIPQLTKTIPRWRGLQTVLLAGIVVSSLVVGVRYFGLLQLGELKAYDQLLRSRPIEPEDRRILIVAITEQDLQIPQQRDRRESLSDLALNLALDKLETYQPQGIGLAIYRDLPVDANQKDLAQRLQKKHGLIAICKVSDPSVNNPGIKPPPEIPKAQKERIGFSDFVIDEDGTLRRHVIAMKPPAASPCTTPYAFSARLAFRYLEAKGIAIDYNPEGNLTMKRVNQVENTVFKRWRENRGGYQKVDARDYQILLNYRSFSSPLKIAQIVTLEQVIQGELNPDDVKDRIVLIGTIAPSLHENQLTPYGEMPRVMIHAQMVSQMISAVLDGRNQIWVWNIWEEGLWILGWSFVGGAIAYYCNSIRYIVISESVALVLLYGFGFILMTQSGWIPILPPALTLLTTGVVVAWLKLTSYPNLNNLRVTSPH